MSLRKVCMDRDLETNPWMCDHAFVRVATASYATHSAQRHVPQGRNSTQRCSTIAKEPCLPTYTFHALSLFI